MKVRISSRAEKQFKKIHKLDQIALAKKIRTFTNSKILQNKEKLSGYKDIFRIRVGQYRIVYRESKSEIFIVLIGHRKDIYQMLRQFLD